MGKEDPDHARDTTASAARAAGGKNARFPPTRWSLVAAASAGAESRVESALSHLCQLYWYPLYVFVRRRGYSAPDAEDLTQGFFARLLSKDYLGQARAGRGKLRSFLLTSLKHYLADEWDRETAQKRGGGHPILSIEQASAEERYRLEPKDEESPDKLFEKRWALTFLDNVLDELRSEFERKGKQQLFEAIQPFLTMDPSGEASYTGVAESLGMTENAVTVAVFRLRKKYGEVIKRQIADTVASAGEADEELQYLLGVIRGE